MTRSLLQKFETLLRRPVPEASRSRAARHLMDWAGCAVAGSATPAGDAFRAAGEPGNIAILGQTGRLSPHSAAMTMGAFGNPLEMDDVDRAAILHPGPIIIPAALVAAQIAQASPTAMFDGIIRGYDATVRLGRTVGPGHYARFHNTATCGPIGAAVASAHILGLTPEQTVSAMGNALTQSAGLWACRHEDVMAKQVHTAHGTEVGVSSALLAQAGVTGARNALEGPQGFYEGLCPDPSPELLLIEPEAWRIHEVSFKPWPACRHCHPAIDAALVLRNQIKSVGDVRRVTISVYGDAAIFCDKPAPDTTIAAKFSLQHAVALTLADGRPVLAGFEAAARARPDLTQLRGVSDVGVDPALTAAYPEHFGASVTIELSDGRKISELRRDAAGDPELPLDDATLVAKAQALMAWGGVAKSDADRLIGACLSLPDATTIDPFLEALEKASPSQERQSA